MTEQFNISCSLCQDEFTVSKLSLIIAQPLLFTKSQWGRVPSVCFQVWKVTLAVYFTCWLGISVAKFSDDYPFSKHEKWLIYLTHWTYLIFTSYLLISAINVCWNTLCNNSKLKDRFAWRLKLQWLLWNIGAPSTIIVVLLYWSILWPHRAPTKSQVPSATNVHVHLLNGIIILTDQALHAMPVHLLHVYQPALYGTVYAVFTGAYFACNGTDPNNATTIYSFLNYNTNIGLAIGADCAVVLIVIPLIWLLLWSCFELRQFVSEKTGPNVTQTYYLNDAFESGNPQKPDSRTEIYTLKG